MHVLAIFYQVITWAGAHTQFHHTRAAAASLQSWNSQFVQSENGIEW
jgi:hypothetical protein